MWPTGCNISPWASSTELQRRLQSCISSATLSTDSHPENRVSDEESKKSDVAIQKIGFHFLKSNQYRTVHADGAFGGLTPRGYIDVNFFSERKPIPNFTSHELGADGTVGPENTAERISKDGIIREVEVGVILDLEGARSLIKWLADKVNTLEALTNSKKDDAR